MKNIEYIIIQAGGKGSRMKHLTKNKPKALVSIKGTPLIFKTFSHYPNKKFIIIGDYKINILGKYLKKFAKVDYTLIHAKESGTCSGIKKALTRVPKDSPFLIMWCDLFLEEPIDYLTNLYIDKNYIGLSRNFTCRWSFKNNLLDEKRSKKYGVAGLFVFKNKKEIKHVPESGEFCKYLKESNISFSDFPLNNVLEIGAISSYNSYIKSSINCRPFNKIIVKNNLIIKIPINKQGEQIAEKEINWYKWCKKYNFNFLPKVLSYQPLILQKINGKDLFKQKITKNKKKEIITSIINCLLKIHNSSYSKKNVNILKNDIESILKKTKKRLDSIIDIIPFANKNYININDKKCINFYKQWDLVDNLLKPYLGKNSYHPIHGDITFSNILIDNKSNIFFIDPRGYYGTSDIVGDVDYDWSKLYYSIKGNYDQFNNKNFRLQMASNNIELKIKKNNWESLENYFFKLTQSNKQKIMLYHAIIWLSLSSYAWDDFDSICGAFYNGILLMQKEYEKSLK